MIARARTARSERPCLHPWANALAAVALGLDLAGCSRQAILDKPRTIRVEVPVVQPVDPALVADCRPLELAGTTLDALLARLASVEDCLATMRDQAAKLRQVSTSPPP